MAVIILILILLLWALWNFTLIGYEDKGKEYIVPSVDDVFDARCLPIILEHEEIVKAAVIMIHGFPSTPYSYEEAARITHAKGYDVFVPLLPGFGTDPKDLEGTTYSQWYAYMREYYLEKRNHYPRIYIIGTSMGGSMTLDLAREFSSTEHAPDGIVTIAAPVFLNSLRDGIFMNPMAYVARTAALFVSSFSTSPYYGGESVNDGEEKWLGYKGQFVRAGLSFVYALRRIHRSLPSITVPILTIHDTGDATIHHRNQSVILEHVSSGMKRGITTTMQATHNKHILLMYDSVRDSLMQNIFDFFDEADREPTGV